MTKVIILDPGLSELGGHHAATVAALGHQFNTSTDWDFEIWANNSCDDKMHAALNGGTIKLIRHFTTPYYQYFKQDLALSEIQDYLLSLAQEYYSALELSTRHTAEQDELFWCHTLDWQHAYALSLALSMMQQNLPERSEPKVLVGLMYHPSNDDFRHFQRDVIVPFCYLQLAKHPSVSLYAADHELQQDYTQLLARPVGIQPCLLLGQSKAPITDWQERPDSVILFAGDAKPNKGFTELPRLVEHWVKQCPNIEFIVQYTINNGNPVLLEAEAKLFELQCQVSNLNIINEFLDHQQLQQLFQQARGIMFNYHEADYQQQSSGLLWLAVYYQLNVLCLTHTWQQREAKRLDYAIIELNEQQVDHAVWSQLVSAPLSQGKRIQCNDYFQSLFTDIPTWLTQQGQATNKAQQRS